MRKMRGICDSFRLEVLEDYLVGPCSKISIEKKYGLSKGQVLHWLRIFGLPDKLNPIDMAKQPFEDADAKTSAEILSLKLRIKQLESSLQEAEMARDAYDCMIDLAEEKYHIKVRKNSDAR